MLALSPLPALSAPSRLARFGPGNGTTVARKCFHFLLASGFWSKEPEELKAIPLPLHLTFQTGLARDQAASLTSISPRHRPGAGWRSPAPTPGEGEGGTAAASRRRSPPAPGRPAWPRCRLLLGGGTEGRQAQRRPGPRRATPAPLGAAGRRERHRPPGRAPPRSAEVEGSRGRGRSLRPACEKPSLVPVPSAGPAGERGRGRAFRLPWSCSQCGTSSPPPL